jgi:restriction system protein
MDSLTFFNIQNVIYPILFAVACVLVYVLVLALLFYRFLVRWVPEFVVKLLAFAGSGYILYLCAIRYEWVREKVADWTTVKIVIGASVFLVLFAGAVALTGLGKRRSRRNS